MRAGSGRRPRSRGRGRWPRRRRARCSAARAPPRRRRRATVHERRSPPGRTGTRAGRSSSSSSCRHRLVERGRAATSAIDADHVPPRTSPRASRPSRPIARSTAASATCRVTAVHRRTGDGEQRHRPERRCARRARAAPRSCGSSPRTRPSATWARITRGQRLDQAEACRRGGGTGCAPARRCASASSRLPCHRRRSAISVCIIAAAQSSPRSSASAPTIAASSSASSNRRWKNRTNASSPNAQPTPLRSPSRLSVSAAWCSRVVGELEVARQERQPTRGAARRRRARARRRAPCTRTRPHRRTTRRRPASRRTAR